VCCQVVFTSVPKAALADLEKALQSDVKLRVSKRLGGSPCVCAFVRILESRNAGAGGSLVAQVINLSADVEQLVAKAKVAGESKTNEKVCPVDFVVAICSLSLRCGVQVLAKKVQKDLEAELAADGAHPSHICRAPGSVSCWRLVCFSQALP
jgi:hypothetical protein